MLVFLLRYVKISKTKSQKKANKKELKGQFKITKRRKTYLRVKADKVKKEKKTQHMKLRKELKKILLK